MVGIRAAVRPILCGCPATDGLVAARVVAVGAVARSLLAVVVSVAALVAGTGVASAQAPAGDIGVQGASYAPLGGSPTGSKPESKLWFNDGRWWASMFAPASGAHHIFWLDRSTGTWTDTGTAIDPRPDTRADALWDAAAGKLYVASHVFTTLGAAAAPANAGKLWRFSYAPATQTYSLDPGFPVDVNGAATETLVIDKDSTGVLWATWTQDSRVFVNHATASDATWGTPFVVPTADPATTTLSTDDISSVVHFGGEIGVMWSNQADGRVYFATHADDADDSVDSWSTTAVPTGTLADDHVSLRADGDGHVYAAVKTSENVGDRPLIQLLVRAPDGSWSSHTVGLVSESHTRPIVLVDEEHGVAHVLATCPQPPATSGQSGGDICDKSAPIDAISFPRGPGRPVIRDAGSREMNDVTSTKQPVGAESGLVVMANNAVTGIYWHADEELAGPVAPVGDFAVTPAGGAAPLTVHFTDTSSGPPTEWSWDFGDGSPGSTEQSPAHVYTRPGSYDVTLTVTNDVGADTVTKAAAVRVEEPAQPASVSPAPVASPPAGVPVPPATAVLGRIVPRAPSVGLRAGALRDGRVLLSGTIAPGTPGLRVSLQRRSASGRWILVARTTTRALGGTRARYAFRVRRHRRTQTYRVVLPALTDGTVRRAASRAVRVRGTGR
jgi:trimeric autotransporter adhesin